MKVLTNLGIALTCVLFFTLLVQTVEAATYYVDFTDGNDINDGLTPETAWKNLSKATNAASSAPGDSILFERGETWTGKITINESGTSDNITIFGAYGTGSNPIINATGQNYGVDIQVRSYLRFENLTIQGATTGQFLILGGGSTNITLDGVATSGGSYGIYILSGTNGPITIANSTLSNFSVAAIETNNTLNGLNLTNVTATSGPIGLSINGTPTGIYISNCTFSNLTNIGIVSGSATTTTNFHITGSQFNSNTNGGVFLQGNLTNLSIDSSFFNLGTFSSGIRIHPATGRIAQTINIDDITANYNGGSGISFGGAGSGTGVDISEMTASNNTANGGITIQSSWSDVSIEDSIFSSNTGFGLQFWVDSVASSISAINISDTIANSNSGNGFQFLGTLGAGSGVQLSSVTASENTADGINVKGNWSDVDINGCTVELNGVDGSSGDGDGISYHDSTTGSISRCFASNNIKSAIAHVGSSSLDMSYNILRHDTNGTIPLAYVEGSGTYTFYNNVLYSGGQTGVALQINWPTGPTVTAKNNIIYGFSKGIEMLAGTVTDDYNIIHNSVTPWTGVTQGTNSSTVNPLFIDAANDNFMLQTFSPAIDAGVLIPGITEDFYSNEFYGDVDIGVYEYQPSYTMGINGIDIEGNIRIYSNGRYRDTVAPSSVNAHLSIFPEGDYSVSDLSEYMNVVINDWVLSGNYHRRFTTTLLLSDNLTYTISDLLPNTLHRLRIGGGSWAGYTTANDGKLAFSLAQSDQATEIEVIKDAAAPTGSVNINSNNTTTFSTNVTLSLSVTDNFDSPSSMLIMISNNSNFSGSSYEAFNSTKSWVLTGGYGKKTVYVKFKDQTGNESSTYFDEINYPYVVPTTTSTVTANTVANNPVISYPVTDQDNLVDDSEDRTYVRLRLTDESGNPLANAQIIITELNIQGLSDEFGYLNLGEIIKKNYDVDIAYEGVTYNKVLNVADSNETIVLNINVTPSTKLFSTIIIVVIGSIVVLASLKLFRRAGS